MVVKSRVGCLVFVMLFVAAMFAGTFAQAAEEKITLHYLTWAGPPGADYIREDFIEPFQKLHPNIEIKYEYTSFGDNREKLMTYYAAGNAPDLMHMSVGWVYDLAKLGMLANLQPFFDRDLRESDFFMEPFKAMRYPTMENGDLYGIPFAFVLTSLFYNKSMFNNYGLPYPNNSWTWYDVRDYGKKLAVDLNGDGQKDQWGFFSDRNYTTLDPVIHAFGGRILDENFNVMLGEKKAADAIRFMVDLIHKDGVAPVPGSANTLFNQGKLGMLTTNISNMSGYRDAAKFEWDAALMPIGPEKRVVRLWPDSFAISSTSKHKEAAWEYIKFVITQTKMDRYSGARKVPVFKRLATSREWLEEDKMPNKRVFIESVQYGDPLEFRPRWDEWDSAKNAALLPAWRGQISVEQAISNAVTAIRNIVSKEK